MQRNRQIPLGADDRGEVSPARADPQPWKKMGWKDGLNFLLESKGRATTPRKGRQKPVSMKTIEKRELVLFSAFHQLEQLGFHLKSLDGFKRKHVEALAKHWESNCLSASTIQNRISVLRTLAEWLGKTGMVGRSTDFVLDPKSVTRSTTATYDHSWSGAGVDAEAVIQMASAMDKYVGMQLRLCLAFALRREEAVMFKPHRADKGSYIEVVDGTKGGRPRVVFIRSESQRQVLEDAKSFVKGINGHVGSPSRELKSAIRRFSYVLGKCGITKAGLGVTAHGLRHETLCNLFEELAGVPAPIRVGNPREVLAQADPDKVELARAAVAEMAGHARVSISSSYLGGLLGRNRRLSPAEHKYQARCVRFFELHARSMLTDSEKLEKARLRKVLRLDEDSLGGAGAVVGSASGDSDGVDRAAGGA